MRGGAEWEREIEQKLRACDIFLLLVSRHSMASDYVVDKEIPIIRERQAKGEAVQFYPLVLTPTPRAGLDVVRDKNLRPRDGKPLSDYPLNERYRHMNEAANDMGELAGKVPPNPRPPDPVRPRRAWILVAGTGNTDTLPARLDETCRKLGASLANAGYGLVTGGWRGVDEQTGRYFARELSRIGVPLEDRLIQVVNSTRLPSFVAGQIVLVPKGELEWTEEIHRADVVVLIGGVGGTRTTGDLARKYNRLVLPLDNTGGDARAVHRDMQRDWTPDTTPGIAKSEFRMLEREADGRRF